METKTNKVLSIFDKDYLDWVGDLKKKYRQSKIKAAISVNSEMIRFYWELGRDIVEMKSESRWGSGFYKALSKDLKAALPNTYCFSERNLHYSKKYYELFSKSEILPQVGAELFMIPWNHIKCIIDKTKGDSRKAYFYVQKTIKNNWSRAVLLNFLDTDLYEREGNSVNNFEMTLPDVDKDLAKEIIKDPYTFNFLTIDKKYSERELKDALIANIQSFLLELGTGFAYLGKEYRLDIEGHELFLDMLFYNTRVHAYVVVEVKTIDFKPDFIGH